MLPRSISVDIFRETGPQSASETKHCSRHLEGSSQSRSSQAETPNSTWWSQAWCTDAASGTTTSTSASGDPPDTQADQANQGEFSR